MARYTYVVQDLMSGTLKDELPLRSVTYSHVLNAPGAFSGSIDRRHPKATRNNLDPSRTALYVLRNGHCVWGGIIWTIRSNGDGLNIGAEGFWSYFRKRRLRHTHRFMPNQLGAKSPLEIARIFIDYAQDPVKSPGGNIGVQTGTETTAATVERSWFGYERKKIADIIEALTDNAISFDFDIEVTYDEVTNTFNKRLVLFHPNRGRRTDLVWEIGTHCELSEYLLDGTKQANSWHGIGAGEGDSMVLAQATDTNQIASPTNPSGYPLLEEAFMAKDISRKATLKEYADARLEQRRFPQLMPNVFLRDTDQTRIGSFVCGDWVRLRGGDGFTVFDDKWTRIDSFEVSVSDEGKERTKVEFVKAPDEVDVTLEED